MSALTLADAADECRGWLNGSLGTWSIRRSAPRKSAPGGPISQNAQDRFLWDHIFKRMPAVRRTFRYIDLAANHYKRISNSYFLDRCAHWQGLCVEPNQFTTRTIEQSGTCELLPTCMSDVAGPKIAGAPAVPVDGRHGWHWQRLAAFAHTGRRSPLLSYYPPSKWRRTRMNCSTLGEVLIQRGWAHVDFLSLDVEGHEAAVLRGLFANSDWHGRIDHVLCAKGCDEVKATRLQIVPLARAAKGGPPRPHTNGAALEQAVG